jgi:ADP-dependent NAD(P)H-hydrate dehydratase / NAD(P)H-hydrate epimerase
VMDADALRWLAEEKDWKKFSNIKMVLTPHSGEMAALTGLGIEEIQTNRIEYARRFAREWQQIVVLKGALTVIADKDGRIGLIPVASSALAKAGSGDALSGIIASLIGQGMELFDAACLGAWIHAQAGITAATAIGSEASVLVREILSAIPEVLKGLK